MKSDGAGRQASGQSGRTTFERVLDELGRSDGRGPRYGRSSRSALSPFATFAAPVERAPAGEFASAESWDRAFDWVADPPDPPAADKAAEPPSDSADSIAAELGLSRALTREQLRRARREFMWNNHPDRRPDAPRDVATRRVAIANMLIDRAEDALAERGGSS